MTHFSAVWPRLTQSALFFFGAFLAREIELAYAFGARAHRRQGTLEFPVSKTDPPVSGAA